VSFKALLLTSGLGGFIALSYELLWFRAYSFFSRGAPGTFGLLLGAYLLGIAFGALLTRPFCRDTTEGNPASLRALAWFVLAANVLGFLVIPLMAWAATLDNWNLALPLVAMAAGALGATLPLLSHFGVRPNDRAGAGLSYVYMANIAGSCLGSLTTGYVLLEFWSLEAIAIFLVLLGYALTGLLVLFCSLSAKNLHTALAVLALVGVGSVTGAPLLFRQIYEKLQFKSDYRPWFPFSYVLENRHGVVTVTDDNRVYGGGAYDGVISVSLIEDRNFLVRAYSVAALHPAPRRILMIGLASGAWAQVISNLPAVERLTVVEINPGYLELIARYPAVRSLLGNPKVRIEIDDGRRWLKRHPGERFDAVVQNTTWHWRAHISNLLSKEYLALVREHLEPSGIFHYNTTGSLDVLRTAVDTFPYALRVGNFVAVSDAPFEFDAARWRATLEHTVIDGAPIFNLERPADKRRFDALLALAELPESSAANGYLELRQSIVARTRNATVVTDDNMISEWREFFH
jgi:spermidine synthase